MASLGLKDTKSISAIFRWSTYILGFPGGSVAKFTCNARRHRFNSWVEKVLGRKWQPTSVCLQEIPWTEEPGELQVHGGHKRVRHDLAANNNKYILNYLTSCVVCVTLY